MNVIATPVSAGGRVSQKEINVIGTMQLLAACQKAPEHPPARGQVLRRGLRLLAARPRDVHRGHGPQGAAPGRLRQGLGRGRGLRARLLAAAGPTSRSPCCGWPTSSAPASRTGLTDYFSPPGHPGAAAATTPGCSSCTRTTRSQALLLATTGPPVGIVNVAGDGVVTVQQAARLAGRPSAAGADGRAGAARPVVRRSGLADFSPDQMQYLAFGRGMDTTRMRAGPAARARFTTRAAFEDFVPRPAPGSRARRCSPASRTAWPARPPGSCRTRAAVEEPLMAGRTPCRCATAGEAGRRDAGADALAAGPPSQRRAGPAPPYAAAQRPGSAGRRRRRGASRAPPASRCAAGTASGRPPSRPRPPAAGATPRRCRLGKAVGRAVRTRSTRRAPPTAPYGRAALPRCRAHRRARRRAAAGRRALRHRGPAHVAVRAAARRRGVRALGEDVERQVAGTLAFLRRRLTGDYTVDEFGFDEDFTEHAYLPLLRPLYRSWFRVEVRGIENIPIEGGALVVANHSGTIALDSLMTQVAVHDEHPAHRHLRMLGADLVFQTPVIGDSPARAARRWPPTPTPSGCWPPASWSASGPRVSRAWASRSASATSCSGSAAAGSSRRRCAPARRSSRARSWGPRRSTRSSATSRRSPG